MLAYKISGDMIDAYLKLTESTATKRLKLFAKGVVELSKNDFSFHQTRKELKYFYRKEDALGVPVFLEVLTAASRYVKIVSLVTIDNLKERTRSRR